MCGLLSVFLLASGYESVYSRSLPLVHTIDPVNLSALEKNHNLKSSATYSMDMYGNFGKPLSIKLPNRAARLDITQPIIGDHGEWLARANVLHLLISGKPRNGSLGVAIMYCRSSPRTISDANAPIVGDNLFMDTDRSWRYVYRVTSIQKIDASRPYVIADGGTSSKLLLSCLDQATNMNIYIEASLLSVQGTDA